MENHQLDTASERTILDLRDENAKVETELDEVKDRVRTPQISRTISRRHRRIPVTASLFPPPLSHGHIRGGESVDFPLESHESNGGGESVDFPLKPHDSNGGREASYGSLERSGMSSRDGIELLFNSY